ncbi:MAG: hypothetical protein BLM47_10580 [Candidatus Reconcilbacillus cellulovorans]|uniref:Uncharacterized protein n=1 Tax=Candidatus Reconcilbacillus cellulovorans TaxID=1906605 RepID=A0A2A6DZ27_9BACL|nr:MAG: hypothetical protein BLM47_10580 [Candidatus Reconcilbacillus cellulovorans]
MVSGLLWIAGCYGLVLLFVHLWHRRFAERRTPEPHFVLVTRNNQQHIEWVVRSLVWTARLRGKSIRISVLDDGSSDDTAAIVARLSRRFEGLRWAAYDGAETIASETAKSRKYWYDLRQSRRGWRVPAF